MYKIIKDVISVGGFKLSEMQHKIKKLYAMGDITEEQVDVLLSLASNGVSTDAERPEMLTILASLSERITALEKRITALDGITDEDTTAHPEWVAWDGISTNYAEGDIVSHNGNLWRSVFVGQNVWEPGTTGTENLWVRYEASEEV